MRAVPTLTLLGAAAILAACGRDRSAASSDLQNDIKLASDANLDLAASQTATPYSLTEVAPQAKPEVARTLHRASGPKAVRTPKPTVAAAPEATTSSSEDAAQTETVAEAPVPAPETETGASLPAAGRPTAVPVAYPGDGGAMGSGGSQGSGGGAGSGTVLGGIFGVILRGGGTGDDDHCEPQPTTRRPTGGYPRGGGGVYQPNPGSSTRGGGWPSRPPTRTTPSRPRGR